MRLSIENEFYLDKISIQRHDNSCQECQIKTLMVS